MPGVPEAEEPQRRHDPADDGRALDHHARHDHRAGRATDIKIAERPAEQLALNGQPVGEAYIEQNPQDTVLGQLAHAVFGELHARASSTSRSSTGLILILAANTAFNGFPVLGSILAKDGYLPRQLHTRGDRLAFSNGILILAAPRRA